jgi:uroporphyrin-III C-methyltransferase/precorrin-2 dehydrogenase/sirohydrochlorin ferrochelatase
MSDYLPIFFNIAGRPCLVVGGGEVAIRKVRQLRRVHAEVHVMAPLLCDGLAELQAQGDIYYHPQKFQDDIINTYVLVIAATNDRQVNEKISTLAQANKIPVNVVDQPELCSFIMPSLVDRDPVQIAISTGGASPVLARLLRSRLETMIPSSYGRLAMLMQEFRDTVKKKIPQMQKRRRFWERILQGPIAEMLFAGQDNMAKRALENEIQGTSVDTRGEVYLVGAGPGDPDLLTFRALRLLQQAEVILYDRLVNPAIIEMARKDAERIYVGKERDKHALPQEEINQLLIKLANEGKRVLRLKGGDPFIFGRGGEEIESLTEAGISFQVVPGITAASACSTYAGIPLTHRDHAQTCVFVTGHMKDGQLELNWKSLVQPNQTIAVYMGIKGIDVLCRNLIEHGMSTQMPAAIIQQGSLPEQKVYIGTISTLSEIIRLNEIKPPSMVIIGQVVSLHEKLAWYEPVV